MSGLPFDDSMSETSSVADEERVKKLFQACDYNGDGYIDSSDLEMVCQELDLGPCVQELLSELGADRTGRVSYKDFLGRRRALRCEIDALKEPYSGGGSSQDIAATTSNSANSFNKQELWEWDSGARDLSPEPSGKPSVPAAPDAMAELASTFTATRVICIPAKLAGTALAPPDGGGTRPPGPSLYYYGDLEKNRSLKQDVPLTHKVRRKQREDEDEASKKLNASKREGVVIDSDVKIQDGRITFNQITEQKRIHTLDRPMKKKKKHKFGRRRTNTYDGETHVHNRTKILRHGNSDTEDLSVTDESSSEDDIDKFATKCSVKNGEDLPLLGALSINNCQVTLADRSKAYLCKNLDLEADDVSITYDVPNTRRSVTYSNAGTFPMPDAKRVGHYDEPNDEANASQLGEDRWDAAGGVRRSRSWYLCCPGSGLAERPANEETTNLDGDRIATITNAPSPGENQYLHLAAVSSLKNEVLELSARLHAAHRDRDSAREALCAAQGECGRLRNTLALQARSSEERMTELHGVIAELRRLCSARDRAAIQELREEDSEVETSCRDNSVTGASDRTTSLGDADETASVHNDQAPETPTSPAALPVPEFPPAQHPQQSQQLSQQLYTPSPHPDTDTSNRNLAPADSTSFDEEETIEIDRRLRCRRRPSPRSPRRNNTGEQSPRELQQQQDQRHPHDREEDEELQQRFPSLALSRQHSPCVRSGVIPSTSPQTKMASRVRLRRTHEDARLTGKDICQEGVYSSAVAEHLTRGSTSHCEEEGEGEERLNARLDRLEADNMLLAVTLRESKEHADRLSLACAQCSAEAGALRMALAAADRAVEAYDVLLALAETSEHTQDGSGSGSTVRMRVATERVARGLLARLDGEAHGQLRAEALGPWADPAAMLLYQCDNDGSAWTLGEEERLRGHVSRLKRERTVAASGAQPAQWPLLDDGDGIEDNLSGAARGSDKMRCLDAADARKLDMETAVLMQEVMSLREERAELRARLRSLRPPGTRQTNSLSGAEEGESERRLLEALARENTLKTRLQRLMASVNQANCNMDNNEELRKCPRCGTQPVRNIPWEEVPLERTVGEDPPALAPPGSEQMNDGVAYESQTTTHEL